MTALILLLILFTNIQQKLVAQSLTQDSQTSKEVEQLLTQVQELTGASKYDAAMPLAERALAIAEKGLQADDLYVADALAKLAYLYAQKRDYEKAEPLYQRALAIGEKGLGQEHLAVVVIQGHLAELYENKQDYDKAEELYKHALTSAEKKTEAEARSILAFLLHGLADVYYHKNDYDRAVPFYKQALTLWEKIHGTEHPIVAAVLHRLARIYIEKAKYIEAELFAKRALVIEEKASEAEHMNVARLLLLIAEIYIKRQDYDRADTFLQRAIRLLERDFAQNPASFPFAQMLVAFADRYKKARQYEKAELLYKRALAIVEKSGKPEYPDVALYVYVLAELYDEKRNYDQAERLYRRALGITEKAVGSEHKEVADHIVKLASLHDKKADYVKAEEYYRRALSICEKVFGTEHIQVAYTLSSLAWIYIKGGDYEKAEPIAKRALSITEKVQGQEHGAVALALHNLAYIYYLKENYSQAESLFQRALSVREKEVGNENMSLVLTLNMLASLYSKKKEYERAEQLYRRALTIQEKELGPKHPDVALTLNNLAWMYDEQGDYGKVEPLFQRALAIREETLGREHLDVAFSLMVLADMYGDRGDYVRAEILYQRALAIREKVLGAEHPDVASTLNNLAWIYFSRNDYLKAEGLSKRALKINENKLGPDHPSHISVLNLLALIYKGQGDFSKAEPIYQRALKIAEKSYGSNSTSITQSLHNLSLLYVAKGDYAKAELLLQRAIAIEERAYGPTHPDHAENLTSLAYLYAAKGETTRAVEALTRGAEISERNIANMLATAAGTEEQKRAFMATQAISNETHGAVSLHLQMAPDDPRAARLALTTLLRRKGRVLDAVSDSMRALRRRSTPEDRALLDQLASARARLASFALTDDGKGDKEKYQDEMEKLEAEAQRLEATISTHSTELRFELQPVTLESIQKAMPTGAALVEIVSYKPFNLRYKKDSGMWGAWRYAGYVLRHEGGPSWIDLGEAAQIDGAIVKLREAFSDPHRADVKELARALDERLMRPVRKLLGGAQQVFISPDGALNLIPFSALVDEQGRYLVESYSITYLTSGHDLLRLQLGGESKQPPVIVADPLFDLQGTNGESQTTRSGEIMGGRRSVDMREARFTPLPGTADEAKALGAILPQAKILTRENATESALKQVTAPLILHVATHGFFLADQSRAVKEDTRGLRLSVDGGSASAEQRIENPLLRSGLALAGANARQSVTGEDGILTALEAAGLNLWGTELVVLSACETGVGDVRNGDGVHGLRRALIMAGSRSQVMSLWQVSDEVTRDMMVSYYQRLQAGEGRTEALRAIQLEMIKGKEHGTGDRTRDIGQRATGAESLRSHPYFWAAFIQSGDWRGMSGAADKK